MTAATASPAPKPAPTPPSAESAFHPAEGRVEISDAPTDLQPPARFMSEEAFHEWAMANNVRAEWAAGKVTIMPPVSDGHTTVLFWLIRVLGLFIEHKKWGWDGSDMFVRLGDLPTRRIPDYFAIREDRRGIVKKTLIDGPPDLIIEIVSDDSVERDYNAKFRDYEKNGVGEYWIIDPLKQHVECWHLHEGHYRRIEEQDGKIHSKIVDGFWFRPADLWQDPRPDPIEVLRELGVL